MVRRYIADSLTMSSRNLTNVQFRFFFVCTWQNQQPNTIIVNRPNDRSTVSNQRVLRVAIRTQLENQVGNNRLDAIAIVAALQADGIIFSARYNYGIVRVRDKSAVLYVLKVMHQLRRLTWIRIPLPRVWILYWMSPRRSHNVRCSPALSVPIRVSDVDQAHFDIEVSFELEDFLLFQGIGIEFVLLGINLWCILVSNCKKRISRI
jgi:hypothetical protein